MSTRTAPPDRFAQLERFLVHGTPMPDVAVLERWALAPLAYTRMATSDPARDRLHGAFTRAVARHLLTKLHVLPLLRAWSEADIEVVVFKGFYLAECVYEYPAQRHYHDVDVLLRSAEWSRAAAIALELGWKIAWSRHDSLYRWSHEEAVLAKDGVIVEVHRHIVDCAGPSDRVQHRLTEAAWTASSEATHAGTRFRVLEACDEVLMGLVLARAWSGGDDWHLKAADYPDLQHAVNVRGVTEEALRSRALELECERSLDLILQRCDPWRMTLDLRPPTRRQRWQWYRAVAPERGHLGVERLLSRTRRAPGALLDVFRALPHLMRVAPSRRGFEGPAEPSVARASRRRRPRPVRVETMERMVRGIKLGARLLTVVGDPCMLRSYALYDVLRRTPHPVRLYEGRSRHKEGGERLHAWVEVDGVILRNLVSMHPCAIDEVVTCYASAPNATAANRCWLPGSERSRERTHEHPLE